MEPLVSIVVPLYNKAAYVGRALDSIRAQSWRRWECIVVDDGSTDGSPERVPTEDERFRLFHQQNRGPAVARNRGMAAARGDFVAFLDADDEFLPDKLTHEIEALAAARDCDWALSGFRHAVRGRSAEERLPRFRGGVGPSRDITTEAYRELESFGIHVDALLLRRASVESLRFDPALRCFEVTEFVIRLFLEHPRGAVLRRALTVVHDVPDSAFKVREDRVAGLRNAAARYSELAERHPRHGIHLRQRARRALLAHSVGLAQLGQRRAALHFLASRVRPAPEAEYLKTWLRVLLPPSRA